MAELILTDAEKNADSHLDWDDDAIGKAVRRLAIRIGDEYGQNAMTMASIASVLCSYAAEANSEETVLSLDGVIHQGVEIGDFEVKITRKLPG